MQTKNFYILTILASTLYFFELLISGFSNILPVNTSFYLSIILQLTALLSFIFAVFDVFGKKKYRPSKQLLTMPALTFLIPIVIIMTINLLFLLVIMTGDFHAS